MKKITLILSGLVVLSLASCKKAYDCTCETKVTSATYTSLMNEYDTFVDGVNDNIADSEADNSTTTVISLDKISKANANANCVKSVESTDYSEEPDDSDADGDNDENESAYSVEYILETTCELEKK